MEHRTRNVWQSVVVVVVALVAVYAVLRAVGVVELATLNARARMAEADARRIEAQAEQQEQRQQTLTLIPSVYAAVTDTTLSVVYALADRAFVVVVSVLAVWLFVRRELARTVRQ